MSNAIIPLAKSYNGKNIDWSKGGGFLSVKLDGMPIRLDFTTDSGSRAALLSVRSRQGTPNESTTIQVSGLLEAITEAQCCPTGAYTMVFEVTHRSIKDFKTVSGLVRRKEPCDDLVLNLFDFEKHKEGEGYSFGFRQVLSCNALRQFHLPYVKRIWQYRVESQEVFDATLRQLKETHPLAEGFVYRSLHDKFVPNSRTNGYLRILSKPTADVRALYFEEAVSKDGTPKGMVGAIWYDWLGRVHNGSSVGVTAKCGAGKLTHAERKTLWDTHKSSSLAMNGCSGLFFQMEYKKDDSYEKPREPQFQHWLPDTTEPSYD